MKKYSFLYVLFFVVAFTAPCKADLQIDTKYTSKEVYAILKPKIKSISEPYGEARTPTFDGGKNYVVTERYRFEPSYFPWKFSGKVYFSHIGSFVPENALNIDCSKQNGNLDNVSSCDSFRQGYQVCHLFLFDEQNLDTLANVTRLHIERDKKMTGLPFCDSVQAMAVTKEIPDSMLITLRYMDNADFSGWNGHEDSKPEEYPITLLLRWSEENGQLKIEQDDSCLGNPNSIATIAEARKKLKQCKEKSAR